MGQVVVLWAVVSVLIGNLVCIITDSPWCWPVWIASVVSLLPGWYFEETLLLVLSICLNVAIFALAKPRPPVKEKKEK